MVNKINQSLEEPVLDTSLDGREFFLASNIQTRSIKNVTIEDTPDTGKVLLSDDVINILQNMLNPEYTDVKSLQDPALRQALQLKLINESPSVQV